MAASDGPIHRETEVIHLAPLYGTSKLHEYIRELLEKARKLALPCPISAYSTVSLKTLQMIARAIHTVRTTN